MCDMLEITNLSELTLKTLAAICYAKHLWLRDKEPRDENPCTRNFERMRTKDYFEATKEVVEEVMNKSLPQDLMIHIIEVVKTIGKRLEKWVWYCTKTLGFGYEGHVVPGPGYYDFLQWTKYGTIDEASMFEEYYEGEDEYYFYKYCKYGLKEMGCSVACIDFMEKYAEDLRATLKECFKFNFRFKHHRHYALLASSLLYIGKGGSITEKIKARYNPMNKSGAALMFSLSARDGYYLALQYYWDEMTPKEQKLNLINAAVDAIQMSPTDNKKTGDEDEFDYEKYNFILAFLLDKMTESERNQFLVEYEFGSKMLIILASSWPWQEYFVELLREIEDELTVEQYLEVLTALANLMLKDAPLGYNIEHSVYYKLFNVVLLQFQDKDYFLTCNNTKSMIDKFKALLSPLYDLMLIPLLDEILNDDQLKKYRKGLLNCGKPNILGLLKTNGFEKLEKFANDVLETDKERKKFKMSLNIWENLILDDKYSQVDQLLSWQADSAEERALIKNKIDLIKICEGFFKENDFDAADKFLNWKCESAGDKSKIINHFNTNEKFLCNKFYEVWTSVDAKDAKNKSDKFLMIMFQSENNIVKFIKEKILKDKPLEKFCDGIHSSKKIENVTLIEEFLQFCRMTESEFVALKFQVTSNINYWIKKYAVEKDDVELADGFLKWAFPNDEWRAGVIKNFLTTEDGLLFSEKMFREHYGKNSAFVLFTSAWVKPCGSITVKKIKDRVMSGLKRGMLRDHLDCIESALDQLMKGKDISDYDLEYIENDKEERKSEKRREKYMQQSRFFAHESESSTEDEDSEDSALGDCSIA